MGTLHKLKQRLQSKRLLKPHQHVVVEELNYGL
jgi:hypothetical protein